MARSLAYEPRHALNAICPYYTMFPLEYPLRVLKRYQDRNPIILDPFCGRGTTIYAAREMGFPSWGIDSSPIAVAIARAKLASCKLEHILSLAETLIARQPAHIPDSAFFKKAFHKTTLSQLCSLREGLQEIAGETDQAILLRAAALGCLHGPFTKTSPSYFSNQMPRTFAAKPDYAIKFWKKRNLKAPKVSVIDVLEKKLKRITRLEEVCSDSPSQVLCMDSRREYSFTQIANNFSLVITSPPYLGMNTYISDQWLRMWFLGGPDTVVYEEAEQLKAESKVKFVESLAMVWDNLQNSRATDLHLHIRFGTLPSVKSNAKEIIHSSLEHSGGWRVAYTQSALTSDNGKRQADLMASGSSPQLEYDFHVVRN